MRWLKTLSMAAAAAALSIPAGATPLASNPIVIAVHHGDCAGAVELVNHQLSAIDAPTAFLAARMLDEGVCVQQNHLTAVGYLARAADLGDKPATLDYAAKVGLGEGSAQNYEQAGILCRTGGLDPDAKISTYSLGYACTLAAVAGEQLRVSLPKGAFRPNSGALIVAFSPSSAQIKIRSMPGLGEDENHTGSNLRRPLIDAPREIDKAWRSALAAAPKPESGHLDDQVILLPLDVDMTLEVGSEALGRVDSRHFGTLQMGEVFAPLRN
jgi:hypothetical protein